MSNAEKAWERLWMPAPTPAKLGLRGDIFGPQPEELTPLVEGTKAQYGPESFEYAQELLGLGQAYGVQCQRLEEIACYEQALAIYRKADEAGWLMGWAWTNLGIAKQSANDLPGAEAALSEAVAVWDRLLAAPTPAFPLPEQVIRCITRCREDLENLRRVNAFYARRPLPILPE